MSASEQNGGAETPEQKRDLLRKLLQEKMQKPQEAGASCAQRRLWLINQLETPNPSYNVPFYMTLRGDLDVDTLQRSLDEVVRRHAILRTWFRDDQGRLLQVVEPELTIPLVVVDLDTLDYDEAHAQARDLLIAEAEDLFDLGRLPLVRAKIVRLSEREFVLVVVMHHIISDGWSVGVFVHDLFQIYDGLRSDGKSPLPALPMQYLTYSAHEEQWLQGDDLERQLGFWVDRLAGMAELDLPTDRRRPLVKRYRGAVRSFVLDEVLTRGLKRLCEREGVTFYMMVSAIYTVLLHRYTGQQDVVFGVPIANRARAEFEQLIGFFANMLVMRNDVSGDPSFRELLAAVSRSTLDAYANQDLPFDQLVERLQPGRDPSRNPLFQVSIALHNEPIDPPRTSALDIGRPVIPSCDVGELDIPVTNTRFDLELHLWEGQEGVRGTWAFDVDLFDAETIDRMSGHFEQLARSVAADPGRRVSDLNLLTLVEREQLLESWALNPAPYPEDSTVAQLFEQQCEMAPNAPAIRYGEQVLSYAELNARANRLARYLAGRNVGAGALIGVCLNRGTDKIESMLAAIKLGCAYVPLDPEYPAARLKLMLEDSGVPVVLTTGRLRSCLPEYDGEILVLDEVAEQIAALDASNPVPAGSSADLAYVIYTSGSTGRPKGVAVPQRGIIRLVRGADYVCLTPDDRLVQASSGSFDAATFEIWGALLNGAELVGIEREQTLVPATYAAFLRDEKISVMFITTALFNQIAREQPTAFAGLRAVLFGGEAVDVDCVRRVLQSGRAPRHLLHVYGPTENTTFSSWYQVQAVDENAVTVPIGRAIANSEMFVLDPGGNPVPAGVVGELFVGGAGLANGYWRQPELTEERFVAHPFNADPQARLYRTGDLVRWRRDGVVDFIGRIDHQVKLRGFRIELGEIESRLQDFDAVREAVVIVDDGGSGEKILIAYVVAETGKQIVPGGLKARLQEVLPAFMVPSVIIEVAEIPLTHNGKIDREKLPRPEPERQVTADYVVPDTELERQTTELWAEILGLQQVGVDDNFFDLGGDSFLLVRLHSALQKKMRREIPIIELFRYPTVRALAQRLGEGGDDGRKPPRSARDRAAKQRAALGMRERSMKE